MNAAEENQQWAICAFCGAYKVLGAAAAKAVESMIARGTSKEDAEDYVNKYSCYLECPVEKEHKEVSLVPFDQLEHGAYYHGNCRNATIARWNAERKRFVYMREKFGEVYPEEIGYWIEAKPGERRFDEFRPYGKLREKLFDIPLTA